MSRQNGKAVGFSQRVRLEWLEETANLVLANNDKAAIQERLQELLRDKVSIGGQAVRGNREKTITILLRVWATPSTHLQSLQARGLELLKMTPKSNRLVIHWGMAMASYPFLGDVAFQTGRLFMLQGAAAPTQVQRRIREHYGQRHTVSRAAQRVLRSFVDWGVLTEAKGKGIYTPGQPLSVADSSLKVWLLEACLHARSNNGTAAFEELLNNPSLFPFQIPPTHAEELAALSPEIEVFRHGLDNVLVMIKTPP